MLTEQLIPLLFHKVIHSKAYSALILGADHKKFAIYVEPSVGEHVQNTLAHVKKRRPHTHQLISSILKGFDVALLQVVINHLEDTIYFARLFLERKESDEQKTILEIDVRGSDALILALEHKAPLYCLQEILEKSVAFEE